LQNSPLESSCVVDALVENYSASKPLNLSPEKSQILSCDSVVANGRYVSGYRDKRGGDIAVEACVSLLAINCVQEQKEKVASCWKCS
jgi:hypothetical protein